MATKSFEKYGLTFTADTDLLAIELDFIRKGGGYMHRGRWVGGGLFTHYREAQTLLWPEDDHHRWSDLCLKTICENELTVILGAADGSKTYNMVRFALVDWFAAPRNTLSLVSSTDVRGLELRIWGKMKELFNRAKDRYDWLDGYVFESQHSIGCDRADDKNERGKTMTAGIVCVPCIQGSQYVGMSKFIGVKPSCSPGKNDGRLRHFGDECFPTGTPVDTPTGPIPIEQLKAGDLVISAIGPRRIRKTFTRQAPQLVRLWLSNGDHIDCTPNHRFLTSTGWRVPLDIHRNAVLLSVNETLHCLRQGNAARQGTEEVLFQGLPAQHMGEGLCVVQETIHPTRTENDFLFTLLCGEMEDGPAGDTEEDHREQGLGCCRKEHQSGCSGQSSRYGAASVTHEEPWNRIAEKEEGTWYKPIRWLWNRLQSHTVRGSHSSFLSRRKVQLPVPHRNVIQARASGGLCHRFCMARHQISRGSRWELPSDYGSTAEGLGSGQFLHGIRVDRVEILKQDDSERNHGGKRGYTVHNLAVEGHPSYSVHGVIAHNCQVMKRSFLDAYSNWYGKQNFKGVMCGNPFGVDDPLGIAAEPVEGWTGMATPTKTCTWKGRFFDATVVNLVGTDSPNFDFPQDEAPRYPYLINRKKIDAVSKMYGKDSFEYCSQCEGIMRPGLAGKLVITRELCRKHHAHDTAVWLNTTHTKIYGLDPAYGGGDRCVGMVIEMGEDPDGKQIIKLNDPEIIPVTPKLNTSPEDQIAMYVKNRLEEEGIPTENCFYDSTGKGTLGFAFARHFGSNTPVPVDSGARPTKRPVRFDLFVQDKGVQRLKLCDEHYSKFVTEMWFSVREAIEAEQVRELPIEVMEEGCMREYGLVAGGKIEVKPKDEIREKFGRSPDLFDCLAIGVEGCRRRGFQIKNLAVTAQVEPVESWYDIEARKYSDTLKSKLLTHV